MTKDLSAQVEAAFHRLESLRCSNLPHQELTSKLLAELSSTLQELQAATAELFEQNEELLSGRLALEEERRRYRELFEFAPDGYVVTDTEGLILDANSAAAALLNLQKSFIIKNPLAMFVHRQQRNHFRTLLVQLKKGNCMQNRDWEFVLLRKRTTFPASLTVKPVTSRGKTAELRWLLRDITVRKQMEEELQKTDKLESLGILAGGIAHDFNNLLTVILGNHSLAKMYAKKDEKVSRHLQEMEQAIRQSRSLTEQLLTFASGGVPLTKAVSLRSFVEEVSAFALSGSSARCEFSFCEDLPPVEIDSGQITQVISNLLINADQAMPEGGTIKISVGSLAVAGKDGTLPLQPGDYVALTITDEGSGIPKKHQAKIFDPYFSTKKKGNGIGLTICYSIIKKHDGHISVKSAEGEGASFTVYLPVSRKMAKKEVIEDTLRLGEGKVLFMDDEENVRQTAGEMLTFLGYEVDLARDGAEAVKLYKEAFSSGAPYDAVITDLTVRGGMGGKQTVSELLKIDPNVKAIVSSGYSDDALLSDYEKYGFCDVVAKPYRLQELGEVLSGVLRDSQIHSY
ncbi:MAG: PAS domain S-box protein [Dethiobacter sp.]|nr:PAS domain S-box protein [Dethiobacter sp.]